MYEQDIIHQFPNMAELYNHPRFETENWLIRTYELQYPRDYYAILTNSIPPGTYVSLNCKNPGKYNMDNTCMMSDTPMEKFTNQYVLNYAKGNILIAGLGIGMLPVALAAKDDVKSITIIELEPEIIELVEPLIRKNVKNEEKITIIQADAYQYPLQNADKKYDWVYLDIWDTFPGYADDLPMLENIMNLYSDICPSGRIQAWGYEFAEAGLDNSPIEVDAFDTYLRQLGENRLRASAFTMRLMKNVTINGQTINI